MSKIDDELLKGCKNFLDEMNRVELAKEQKKEEEKQAHEHREARRNFWREELYGKDSQAATLILPEDSELL